MPVIHDGDPVQTQEIDVKFSGRNVTVVGVFEYFLS
jgi:hypothetical protein